MSYTKGSVQRVVCGAWNFIWDLGVSLLLPLHPCWGDILHPCRWAFMLDSHGSGRGLNYVKLFSPRFYLLVCKPDTMHLPQ